MLNKQLCVFPSWFWGPVVTLQDCLAAFFARDELKGKRMVSKICSFNTNTKIDVSIIVCLFFYRRQYVQL